MIAIETNATVINEKELQLENPIHVTGKVRLIILVSNSEEELQIIKKAKEKRPRGLAKGQIQIFSDFNGPLPDDLLNSFYEYNI